MKKLISLLLSIICALGLFAQQWSWLEGQELSYARAGLFAVVLDDSIFFTGGATLWGSTYSNIVDIYDVGEDTWTTSQLSGPARWGSACVAAGDKVFIAGGNNYSNDDNFETVDIFNKETGQWTVEELSVGRTLNAVAYENNVYFAGGNIFNPGATSVQYSDVVDIYNLDTETWSVINLSEPRGYIGVAAAGGKVFFAGGVTGNYATSGVVDIYDPDNNTWSIDSIYPRGVIAAVSFDDKVYFAGGSKSNGTTSILIDVYNTTNNAWEEMMYLSSVRIINAIKVMDAIVFAGMCNTITFTGPGYIGPPNGVIEVYYPGADLWEYSIPDLSPARWMYGIEAYDNRVYFAGGNLQNGGTISTVNILNYAPGEIIHVPGDYPTIQEAINVATLGDTVLVAEGMYAENINFKGKAITVASEFILDGEETHIENTILNGNKFTNQDSASVVIFCSGEDTTSIIQGFTITGGEGSYCADWGDYNGGGIYITDAGAKILNNKIIGNIVDNPVGAVGGGISTNLQGEQHWVVIENNYIADNECLANDNYATAGGVYVGINGRVINNIIENNYCNCQNNTANAGGFMGSCESDYNHFIEFSNNSIIDNEVEGISIGSSYCGSGGMTFNTTDATIKNNVISGNISNSSNAFSIGAGAYLNRPNNYLHILNNTFSNNISNLDLHGGGIYLNNTGTAEILLDGNLLQNNHASLGGGMYVKGSYNVHLTNNVFTGNSAESNGGAISFRMAFKDINSPSSGRLKSANKPNSNINKDDQNPAVINNTFFNNTANTNGGAIYSNYTWLPRIINSIFWENEAVLGPDIYNTYSQDIPVFYSNIDTNLIYGNWDGDNNMNEDPLFIDDTCHIDETSNCREVGVMNIDIEGEIYYSPDYDFDMEPRPNITIDIGADEWYPYVRITESKIVNNNQLLQNFPNPFTGITTFTYELGSDCYTDLSIFDLSGKKVLTLISENQKTGIQQFELNADGLKSGVYFCVLKTNEGVQTTKMIKL